MKACRVIALAWLGLIVVAALTAPWLAPADPAAVNPDGSLAAPSWLNWLGTDLLGRDVFGRLVWGSRRTLGMAMLAVVVTSLPGASLGVLAGGAGDPWDGWLMRVVEVGLALPQLLVALVTVSILGASPASIGLAVGLSGMASFARLARSAVQQVRGQTYVQAAQALGLSPLQVALRHLLPNVAGPLATYATIHFAWAILNTATLTFLGFGGSPATPDWGLMLNEGRAYLVTAPWVSTAPGLAIALTVLSVHIVGDAWAGSNGRPRGRR